MNYTHLIKVAGHPIDPLPIFNVIAERKLIPNICSPIRGRAVITLPDKVQRAPSALTYGYSISKNNGVYTNRMDIFQQGCCYCLIHTSMHLAYINDASAAIVMALLSGIDFKFGMSFLQ